MVYPRNASHSHQGKRPRVAARPSSLVSNHDNPRIFYPDEHVRPGTEREMEPVGMSTYDEQCHITRLLTPESTPYVWSMDKSSVVIAVDGACPGNGGFVEGASYGAYFGSCSYFNLCGQLPSNLRLTSQVAELYAAIKALRIVRKRAHKFFGSPGIRKVVIVTDSAYVVDGISRWIWKWLQNGWKGATGRPVENGALFDELNNMVISLAEAMIEVKFWHVPRDQNTYADYLASLPLKYGANLATCLAQNACPGREVPGVQCFQYWLTAARFNDGVPLLAANICLTLPGTDTKGEKSRLMYPIRRLVLSGTDTEHNMKLLFGPKWNDDVEGIIDIWEEARMDVLLCHTEPWLGKKSEVDKELPCPGPRPPSPEEEKELKRRKALQSKLRRLVL